MWAPGDLFAGESVYGNYCMGVLASREGGGFTRTSPSGPRSRPLASTKCTETLEVLGGACMVVCNCTGSVGVTDISFAVSSPPLA